MATYSTPYDWDPGDFATEARMDQISNNFLALFPIGFYAYLCRAATTSETFVNGVWLECNGLSVLRATYPDLNTLLSSLSYPFGTVDGTHMTLPDAQGRVPVSMASGGHTDANALGDSDGLPKLSRTPKGSVTVAGTTGSVSVSGTTGSEASHTHGAGSYAINLTLTSSGSGGQNSGNTSSIPVTGTSGAGSSHSHSFSGSGTGSFSGSGTVPGDFLVGGTLFIKAVT